MHMALLDLKTMETDAPGGGGPRGSRASKGCGHASGLSLLLC
jgi:hypothetical protein